MMNLPRTIFEFLKKHFFDDKELDFDDAFLFLRLISYDLWYNKYLILPKMTWFLYQFFCYLMCLLYLYNFFDEFSSANLTNYITALVATFYALVATTLSFIYYRVYKENFKDLYAIRWSCSDTTIVDTTHVKESQMEQNLKFKKLLLLAMLSTLYVIYDTSPFSSKTSSKTLDEVYLTTKLFHECFNEPVGTFLYDLHWFLAPVLAYATVVESGIILYISKQIQYQFHLLCEDMEQRLFVNKNATCECHLRHCKEYQERIYSMLCFYSDRYLVLKRFVKVALQERLLALTTVYAVFGLVVLICFIFFTLNEFFNPSNINIWMYIACIGAGAALALYMFWNAGQTILDSSGSVFHVLALCPWHIWTPKNRRILATFLLNTEKAEGISIGGVYTFDYNLFIRFFRSAYSIAMILFRLRNAHL